MPVPAPFRVPPGQLGRPAADGTAPALSAAAGSVDGSWQLGRQLAALPVPTRPLADADCAICFELLQPEMDWAQLHIIGGGVEEVPGGVVELPRCGHCFHRRCIARWLGRNSCPSCRAPVFAPAAPPPAAPAEALLAAYKAGVPVVTALEQQRRLLAQQALAAAAARRAAPAGGVTAGGLQFGGAAVGGARELRELGMSGDAAAREAARGARRSRHMREMRERDLPGHWRAGLDR